MRDDGLLFRLATGRIATRLREERDRRRPDVEIRQMRSLQAAYAGPTGPDVLVFGDSAMFWTRPSDTDPRSLAALIDAGLNGRRVHSVVGPGYNPRLVMAFLSAIEASPSRPRLVVVPSSLMMAASSWLAHPVISYEIEAAALAELGRHPHDRTLRLPRATPADWDRYDRLPAASLYGAQRTYGEIRMIVNSIPPTPLGLPTTNWQQLVRVRHLLDLANAEALTAESTGVRLVAEMAARLDELRLPSIAYIAPVNHEVIEKLFKTPAVEQVARNSEVVEAAYLGAAGTRGTVVNGTFLCPAGEFSDPSHLTDVGRHRFAAQLVDAIRARLLSGDD